MYLESDTVFHRQRRVVLARTNRRMPTYHLHFFPSSFPTIPDRIFLLWKDTSKNNAPEVCDELAPYAVEWAWKFAASRASRPCVADNRETVLPGAAVALIGFWRYGSKNGRSATVQLARTCRCRDNLTAHCLIKQ